MRQLLFALLLVPALTFAAAPTYLSGLRIKSGAKSSRFIFVLTKQTQGKIDYLENPHRLVVTFSNTTTNVDMRDIELKAANVTSIRAQQSNQTLKFIFALKNRVTWKVAYLPNAQGSSRLQLNVVDIEVPTKPPVVKKTVSKTLVQNQLQQTFEKDLLAQFAPKETFVAFPKESPNKSAKRPFTIVIDAGHGGHDTGAMGHKGSREKTIVLAIAKRLAQEINKQADLRATLTRNGDYFVPLRSRLKLARKDKADLFIAIHADAFFNNTAAGVSVFALSQRGATTEAARWLARQDNYAELGEVELNTLQDRSPLLRSVLIDLAQTATIRDSLLLGNKILDALDNFTILHYKHVAQAPFVVLKSPDIPSILVETGFISNPSEEKKLNDVKYQQKIANALLEGIRIYINILSKTRSVI